MIPKIKTAAVTRKADFILSGKKKSSCGSNGSNKDLSTLNKG